MKALAGGQNSLMARVYQELHAAIVGGELAPGAPLVEARLSEKLGVSRTPVREALRLLEQDGLIETVPNKCSVVVGIDRQEISDTYDIRIPAFGLCARWAAQRMTDEAIAELKSVLELQEYYLGKGDLAGVGETDARFHELLYAGSGSRAVKQTMQNLHVLSQRARENVPRGKDRLTASLREHFAILEAITRRDPDAAEAAARAHLESAKAHVLTAL